MRFLPFARLFHGDLALHQQAAGAAGGVVDFHAGLGLEHAGHDGADLGRGVELAGALAAAFGELADQVFVALADDVGLDVVEPEALGADGLDEVGEAVVVEVALAVGGGVEVDAVDDALQQRVFPGDGAHVGGDAFADLVGELADDGPDGLLGIVRHQGQVEADELVVGLGELEGLLARADLLGDAVQLVVEDVAQALGEDEREDVVLVFRRVLGAADGAGGIPDPGFERFVFTVIACHRCPVVLLLCAWRMVAIWRQRVGAETTRSPLRQMKLFRPIRRCRKWFAHDCRYGAWLASLQEAARTMALVASALHPDVSGLQTQLRAGAMDTENQ